MICVFQTSRNCDEKRFCSTISLRILSFGTIELDSTMFMLLDVKWAVKHEDIKRSACITYVMTIVFKNPPFLDFIAVKKEEG